MASPLDQRIDRLAELVVGGDVMVLSGAGLSTESGIPDYRGPSGALRKRLPMTYQTFTCDDSSRRRYWARSHVGWRAMERAVPNTGHRAVADLEATGLLAGIVTQNVDGLHQAAGARSVVELHGSLSRVVCLQCGDLSLRSDLDTRLQQANPAWQAQVTTINPDGDVDLADDEVERFHVVGCTVCGGVVKPDVVFFGETVPAERVQEAYELVETARLLLVLGSSLTVMSGRRFVLRAARDGVPVAIVNDGATRGDEYAALTVDARLGQVLPVLAARLAVGGRRTVDMHEATG